jgi:hypothetical protein
VAILTFEVIEAQRRVRRLMPTSLRELRFICADPDVQMPVPAAAPRRVIARLQQFGVIASGWAA